MLGQDTTSGVVVELTPNMITECQNQALRLYNRYRPFRKEAQIAVTAGVQKYVLTTYGKGLVDFQLKPRARPVLASVDIFNPYQMVRQPLRLDEFITDRAHLALAAQVLSANLEWDWERDTHTLWIASNVTESTTGVYTYLEDRAVTDILPDDEDWFLRYTLATAKMPLGRQRSKYAVVRGAEHEFQMDGPALLQEAKDELPLLEQELRNRIGEIGVPLRA